MAIEIELMGELPGGSGTTVAVAPDGVTTVAASTGMATLWLADELGATVGLDDYVGGPIAFTTDGVTAFIGGSALDVASAAVKPMSAGIGLLVSGLDPAVRLADRFYARRAAATAADGTRMIASFVYAPSRGIGDDEPNEGPAGQVVLVDPSAGAFVAVLHDLPHALARPVVSIGARYAVAASSGIAACATADGSPVGVVDDDGVLRSDVRISTDERHVAASRFDGTLELRPFADFSAARTWTGHSGPATAVAFHPEAAIVASGGQDQQVKLWSYAGPGDPELVGWFFAEQEIAALAFHPSGEHLLVATREHVIVTELSGLPA